MKQFKEIILVAILLSIIISSIMVQIKLVSIREVIKDSKTTKIEISDSAQFTKLCQQLTKQWSGTGYAFYLLQPKSTMKTHKEKAGSSLNYDYLPVRISLANKKIKEQLIKRNYVLGNHIVAEEVFNLTNFKCDQFLIIPIYQNTIIIGELYVFYDQPIELSGVSNKIAEAQMLSKLFT